MEYSGRQGPTGTYSNDYNHYLEQNRVSPFEGKGRS